MSLLAPPTSHIILKLEGQGKDCQSVKHQICDLAQRILDGSKRSKFPSATFRRYTIPCTIASCCNRGKPSSRFGTMGQPAWAWSWHVARIRAKMDDELDNFAFLHRMGYYFITGCTCRPMKVLYKYTNVSPRLMVLPGGLWLPASGRNAVPLSRRYVHDVDCSTATSLVSPQHEL